MNFIYVVFICYASTGLCRPYGDPSTAARPELAPQFDTLEACRRSKVADAGSVSFRCFRRPTWTDAEDSREEGR